ncbi:sulfite exporter TauE/SafE family protein [Shewanella maritima]|uniref:sulfite exporter TauE/SafE family protein n=1 Tax=Shewanella maritima TaxID=2520507 RepID=UPI003736C45F
MEFISDPSSWVILAAIGFVAGFIDAVVGGGGLLSIPALLAAGVPPHLALGTNKLAACFGSLTSSYTYYKQHFFTPSFWKAGAIATAIGAVVGSCIVFMMDADWLQKLLPILIICIAVYTFFSPQSMGEDNIQAPCSPSSNKKQASQGFILGSYDGFAGPGIGAFWTVSSIKLHQLPLLHSCGLARAMTAVSNVTALIIFALLGQVHWGLGLWMGICMMLGSIVGAKTAIRYGIPFIKPLFIIVVMAIALQLSWSAWS